jgi:hypothetical protein
MKFKALFLTAAIVATLFTGCGQKAANNTANNATNNTSNTAQKTDTTTTASIVNNAANFETAISSKGTWIIAILNDLTVDKDLVLDGNFVNGKKDANGKDIVQRKIALYAQDSNRKVTARYTLTAPSITIKSPNASIQHGIFKGDVYIAVDNFQLVDQKVEGNIYFASQSNKDTFKMDATSSVTGKQEIKTK